MFRHQQATRLTLEEASMAQIGDVYPEVVVLLRREQESFLDTYEDFVNRWRMTDTQTRPRLTLIAPRLAQLAAVAR